MSAACSAWTTLVVVAAISLGTEAASAAGSPPPTVPGAELILRLSADGDIGLINAQIGAGTVASLPEHQLFLVELPPNVAPQAIINLLAVNESVEWVDLNFSLGLADGHTQSFFVTSIGDGAEAGDDGQESPALTENDFLRQPVQLAYATKSLHRIATGAGITVAVLDSGVDSTHPLLIGKIADGGYDFVTGSPSTLPPPGGLDTFAPHGTFLAGLVAHFAPEAMILPITVLDANGVGELFDVIAGLLHAVDAGAEIIVLALSTHVDSLALAYAIDVAVAADALVVAAAGNDGSAEPLRFPAADPDVLAVGATEFDETKWPLSNFGFHVDLCAPGSGIVSAIPGVEGGGYAMASGTSVSTALVAAGAALVRSARPAATADEATATLVGMAISIDAVNREYAGLLGAGRMSLWQAAPRPGSVR